MRQSAERRGPHSVSERRADVTWGRWGGPDDERGALNAIGPAEVLDALGLVTEGRIVQLGQRLGPRTPTPAHRSGVLRFMDRDGGDYAAGGKRPGGFQFAEDTILLPTHTGTHVDALAHAWHDDELYNGFSADGIRSTTGAQRCGAEQLGAIIGRGVLVDAVGEDLPLPGGTAITRDMLQQALRARGTELAAGDIVLVHTGWLTECGEDHERYFSAEPGLGVDAARWLADAGVAAVGADNAAVERIPFDDGQVFPVHQLLIRDRGVPLIEGLLLDELVEAAATTFLFVALPLKLEGSTGAPVAPVALI